MCVRPCLLIAVAVCGLLAAGESRAQGISPSGPPSSPSSLNLADTYVSPSLEVSVTGEDGKAFTGQAMVQLIGVDGRLYDQGSAKKGRVRFDYLPKTDLRVLVMAPGYQRVDKRVSLMSSSKLVTLSVELLPLSDAEDAASDRGLSALTPKAQKEVGKALEALRTKKPNNARTHLEAAQREAPNSADVQYLFGMYAAQMNDPAGAQERWNKALALNPKHLSALLEMGQQLLLEKKSAEAISYLTRAKEVEPSSWRAHALLAEAEYMQGNRDEAIILAERALELGHERAAPLQPFLAGVLAEAGDRDRAIRVMQDYLKANPSDAVAAKQLEQWQNPSVVPAVDHASMTAKLTAVSTAATALPIPSNWLPPDVDEKMPPVESGAVCSLDDVVQKAGDRLVALVHEVDRFTATESLVDQTFNKWGAVSSSEKRSFTYMVSIQEIRPGFLSVDEYRTNGANPVNFPDGLITDGLPALVMIFHPFYVGNYDITCEGLARLSSGLAWQVHFRQRPDKPIANRGFRVGMRGSSLPVALKGRAWILAENHQIVRLETDLVRPVPEIRLVAERTAIEYGAVSFLDGKVNLWLPRSADVYVDWEGVRVHRRHSLENYLLFSVDEQERIGSPKAADALKSPEKNDAPHVVE
jgi:tetratricopeptide (TPR) repeat protein